MKRGCLIIVGLCLVVVLGLLAWDYMGGMQWDGQFDLPISILSDGEPVDPAQIAAVEYDEHPSQHLEDPYTMDESDRFLVEAPFENGHFVATIRCHGTDSGLGLRRTYGQFRSIFIRIQLKDGRTIALSCPVSDRKYDPTVIIDIGKPPTQPTTSPEVPPQ